MSYRRVAPGIYRHTNGRLYERPIINGRRTFRRLHAHTLSEAKRKLAKRRSDQALAQEGLARSPYDESTATLDDLLRRYVENHCPDRRMRPRTGKSLHEEKRYAEQLRGLLGHINPEKLSQADLHRHLQGQSFRNGSPGKRTLDRQIQTLSNAYNYGVALGLVRNNPIKSHRPLFWSGSEARPSRECRPASGDELHALARALLEVPESQTLGWLCLFQALTGCRVNELLQLRWDAKPPDGPGYIDRETWLWLKRSKGGVNPFIVLREEQKACLDAIRKWHKDRFPRSPWYFPSVRSGGSKPVDIAALTHALQRIGKIVAGEGACRTSHGLRAFYVSVRRSEGAPDGQIAAEIGDKSVALIQHTYGSIPPGWQGGPELSFLPRDARPAWEG